MMIDSRLRLYSKFLVVYVLFLVFAGGMVTSTGSGLAVPDWPLSYGMVFPPMVGGVFFEHGHRLIAAGAGLLTLIFCVLSLVWKAPWPIRRFIFLSLLLVILQGLLGGLTVYMQLPRFVSVAHGVLGQIYLSLLVAAAYQLSEECQMRRIRSDAGIPVLRRPVLILLGLIFLQLVLGGLMRHLKQGLAVFDFPTVGGEWIPTFSQAMYDHINQFRRNYGLAPVNFESVFLHVLHRVGAMVTLLWTLFVVRRLNRLDKKFVGHKSSAALLFFIVTIQFVLGILTVLSLKMPILASLHVLMGAALLATTVLTLLRVFPVQKTIASGGL